MYLQHYHLKEIYVLRHSHRLSIIALSNIKSMELRLGAV